MSLSNRRGSSLKALARDKRLVFFEAILLFLVVWQASAQIFDIANLIASPMLVGAAVYELLLSGEWIPHFAASIKRILYAFVASSVIGILAGVLLGVSDFWREALRYYVLVGMALPGLFVVVFSAMAFGISDFTPMLATVIVTTPFLADTVQSGVEDIDSDLLNMSAAFGASRRRVYRRVLFPSILPEVFASVRFSFSVAWKLIILAEVVISTVGIGYQIRDNMSSLNMVGVLKYLVLFVIVMLFIEYFVFRPAEKYLFDWREDVQSTVAGTQ